MKDTTTGQDKPKRRRTRGNARDLREKIAALESLAKVMDDKRADVEVMCDDLALWARLMMRINPAAAAHIYNAIVMAWRDNRTWLYGSEINDPRDRLTANFHGEFLDTFRFIFDQPARPICVPENEQREETERKCIKRELIEKLIESAGLETPATAQPHPNAEQIAAVRERLQQLADLPENEARRFELETLIYRLERDSEEWPDVIAA